jgi:hypothetical protein
MTGLAVSELPGSLIDRRNRETKWKEPKTKVNSTNLPDASSGDPRGAPFPPSFTGQATPLFVFGVARAPNAEFLAAMQLQTIHPPTLDPIATWSRVVRIALPI